MTRASLLLALSACLPSIALAQGYPAAEAAGRMTLADGLEARLFAAEPMVRQPVAIEFDDRGRLWVIQYLQYPNPSGLSRVSVDRYSRTAYDRVPEPPPRGPKGGDRITILEDRDGDGRADHARDFVTGLNLASGLAFGRGGVFVLQTPYLLFYPDKDRDDRPDGDGDPEVLLTGFGMEDAHSVANSLTWGPDGWLYGLQGSTVTARIRGIEFQQGVWRYHPASRRFELFSEGGGNMWGLDFDRKGNLVTSTNVGGFAMLHAVQGGYYWKSFGKHGPLHNPYTFGYFDHVPHQGVKGGHVSVGGLFYEAENWPAPWRGRYIAADLLDHSVHWDEVSPRGSTLRARRGGDVLRSNDTWFAPSDMTLGPDGAVYVTDWHDRRTAHPDPDADWDRSNGRIYAIHARGAKPGDRPDDLAGLSSPALAGLLDHPNAWYRRRARRLLSERGGGDISPRLLTDVANSREGSGLEALWTLYGCRGSLGDGLAATLLDHPDADMRTWGVRLVGDEPRVAPALAARLVATAGIEPSVVVRGQLACTARRLPAPSGLDIAGRLLLRDLDRDDPYVPLLLWWAVERHAVADVGSTVARFSTPEAWRSGLVRDVVMNRLVRRLAAEGTAECDAACARLIASAPDRDARLPLVAALEEATRGRRPDSVAPVLARAAIGMADEDPADPDLTRLAARLGSRPAAGRVRAIAGDGGAAAPARASMIALLGELGDPDSISPLVELATGDAPEAVVAAALAALARFDDPAIAGRLLAVYPGRNPAWRSRVREVLLGRATWARAYLAEIDRGALPTAEVTIEQVGRVALLKDAGLDVLVRKHWGTNRGATPEEKLAEVRRLNNDLRAAPGDPARGHRLFTERCATCHKLWDEGNAVGPDLTHANRQDRQFLLVSLVDPGGVVRKEYQNYVVQTKDGRVLTGLIAEQTPEAITLRDARGEPTRVRRADVEAMTETSASLMPESLFKELDPGQVRDLFSYLQGEAPAKGTKDQKP